MKKPAEPPLADEHLQQALDEALRESFPASDPIAVSIAAPVAPRLDDAAKKPGPARPVHGH